MEYKVGDWVILYSQGVGQLKRKNRAGRWDVDFVTLKDRRIKYTEKMLKDCAESFTPATPEQIKKAKAAYGLPFHDKEIKYRLSIRDKIKQQWKE